MILTEDELQLLDNALLRMSDDCRNAACATDDKRERRAFEESASQYDALRVKLESSDFIELETTQKLVCDMGPCDAAVTHIDDEGWIYCGKHGAVRRTHGHRCRKLSRLELDSLRAQGR